MDQSVNSCFLISSVGLSSALTSCTLLSACAWASVADSLFFFFLAHLLLIQKKNCLPQLALPLLSMWSFLGPPGNLSYSPNAATEYALMGCANCLAQLVSPSTSPSLPDCARLKGRTKFYLCISGTWHFIRNTSPSGNTCWTNNGK